MDKTNYKLITILIGVFILGSLAFVTSITNNDIKSLIQSRFAYTEKGEIVPIEKWVFTSLSKEEGIEVIISSLSDTEIYLDIKNEKTKNKNIDSVICFQEAINEITQTEYDYDSKVKVKENKIIKEKIKDKNIYEWCEEGFILVNKDSKNKKFKLDLPKGEKSFLIYTGTGTDIIEGAYLAEETINDLKFRHFTVGVEDKPITMVSFE